MSKNTAKGLEKTIVTAKVLKTTVDLLNAYAKDTNQSLSSVVNHCLTTYAFMITRASIFWAGLEFPDNLRKQLKPPDYLENILLHELGITESEFKKLDNHKPDKKLLPPSK